MYIWSIFTRSAEMQHRTNSIVLFHFLLHAHLTNTLSLVYWWMRKNWKGEEAWIAQPFPFLPWVIIFSISGWLIWEVTWVQKGMTGFLGNLVSYNPIAFILCLEQVLVWMIFLCFCHPPTTLTSLSHSGVVVSLEVDK